jgi:NADP-dependent 3-hydroxy acid dehydrogenase YdfG
MERQKVCLVTSAAGQIGQKVLTNLVTNGKKVLALGEPDDVFSPTVLKTHHIKINTALPEEETSITG